MEQLELSDVQILFIGLFAFGFLLFCLCCYKISNYIYILCHFNDDSELSDATNDLSRVKCTHDLNTSHTKAGLFEMVGVKSNLVVQQDQPNEL